MTTILFPGQGAQFRGMGRGLFSRFPDMVKTADDILGYSIAELCKDDPDGVLNQTLYTQPALYVVNALLYEAFKAESDAEPRFLAGHSLGEYNALLAAGVFDFESGLKIVKKRAELMSRVNGGGMAAVIGMEKQAVCRLLETHQLYAVYVANCNSPQQTVVAGLAGELEKARCCFEAHGASWVRLNVSAAFHTPHMACVYEAFRRYLKQCRFSPARMPVISNLYAAPYENGSAGNILADHLLHEVRWQDSIAVLLASGESDFVEIGPKKVLTPMIASIRGHFRETGLKQTHGTKTLPEAPAGATGAGFRLKASHLGSPGFRRDYGVKYAYVAGGMYKGIASVEMVMRMANAGLLSFFGTGGLSLDCVEDAIQTLRLELPADHPYGMNLVNGPMEAELINLFLKYDVTRIEAAAYIQISPSLVKYRLTGACRNGNGEIRVPNRIMAKVSRPEVAEKFLSPPPERVVRKLLENGEISQDSAEVAPFILMADDICVEADSAGHTDRGIAYTIFPTIRRLRDHVISSRRYSRPVHVGAAGGIGTPEAAAAAFVLGADFILTGSINQCTVEAGTSDAAKKMLEAVNVQDTDYAPAGDMFEMGAKVQVLKKGVFFPARAKKLLDLYRSHDSITAIDERTQQQLQEKYFRRSFDSVYEDVKTFFIDQPSEIARAEQNPKHKMALIFKWYFAHATRAALRGATDSKVDYQIQCGSAMGAFNQWVATLDGDDAEIRNWQNRHVDELAERLMQATATLLEKRFREISARYKEEGL